ncbi:hypothetical protein BGZ58_010306 [Dissophora ornata]|nr:hypothetical protein BGZ58_010306 [Dissophora ornata]
MAALNHLVSRLEGWLPVLSFSGQQDVRDPMEPGSSQIYLSDLSNASSATSPVPDLPLGSSTGFNLGQDNAPHRRRVLNTTAHMVEGFSSVYMNKSRSTGGAFQAPALWKRDDRDEPLDSLFDDSDCSGSDETRDDFDDAISLAAPFQLLLVSVRLADAAVQSLWRNLVFHGQDTYQMHSLLSTLSMEDEMLDTDPEIGHHPSRLEKLKEEDVEDDAEEATEGNKEHAEKAQDISTSHAVEATTGSAGSNIHRATSRFGPMSPLVPRLSAKEAGSHQQRPPWQSHQEQGAKLSWIESFNSSLKQFPGLKGTTEVHTSNTEIGAIATTATIASGGSTPSFSSRQKAIPEQQKYASVASDAQHRIGSQWINGSRDGGPRVNGNGSPRTLLHEPRWSYRRYVRRVVLNFAHPRASPHMLVKILKCLQLRCPDQILALDLHANEKMRDAGLEKAEELERLFGSGFSKLRYLRLQGGFVDNQLLCALIKGLNSLEPMSPSGSSFESEHGSSPFSIPPVHLPSPCRLSQVFLGPGSVTDSAIEKLIAAARHSLEVFTVTSCVDVGGSALADLLTKCPKLRVLAVHRSLARDRDLLEGLGIEVESPSSSSQPPEMSEQVAPSYTGGIDYNTQIHSSRAVRKPIVAPLERLELGTVKLTRVGITEILKGTCSTLRFLVLETQHFSEELLTEVVAPFCTQLEGLYFDDPEHVQRQQQQMQGLGFSAGRRGLHLPNRHFEFGRFKRAFYSDPNRQYQPQQQRQYDRRHQSQPLRAEFIERQTPNRITPSSPKISAWLGETSTKDWITYGDCALWTSAASPSVSFENGGANSGSQGLANQHHRRQPLPLHHAYHSPVFMSTVMQSLRPGGGPTGFNPLSNSFLGEYEDVLGRFRVTRATVENVQQTLRRLSAFTVMQIDFMLESQGLSEWKMLIRQDEIWVQSAGFRALQLFYLCLLLSTIYLGTLRW